MTKTMGQMAGGSAWLASGLLGVALLATTGAACAQAKAADADAPLSSAYDGSWWISLTCDDVRERDNHDRLVKGYNFEFVGTIANGRLTAQYGKEGQSSSLHMTGEVRDGGVLLVRADGITGSPDFTIGAIRPGSPYGYTMDGRLDDRHGTAIRRNTRPCKAVFAKQ